MSKKALKKYLLAIFAFATLGVGVFLVYKNGNEGISKVKSVFPKPISKENINFMKKKQ